MKKRNAIVRIILWSLLLVILLGILFVGIAGISYRNLRVKMNANKPTEYAVTWPVDGANESQGTPLLPGLCIAKEAANIRETPHAGKDSCGMVNPGEQVTVAKVENISGTDWAFIESPNKGWVMAEYLKNADTGSNTDAGSNAVTVPADQVTRLSIDWASGSITVRPDASVQEITFSETGGSKYPMSWKLKNGKLSIQYYEDDTFRGLGAHFDRSKDLTVLVPNDWSFEELDLDVASAVLDVSDLTIHQVDVDSASGTCNFRNCAVSNLEIDTASGDVSFEGRLNSLEFDAASAKFTGILLNTPNRIDVDSMSGDVDLTLPADTGFTVKMDGMSSNFSSDFNAYKRDGSYVWGDGRCRVYAEGMSCHVTIRKGAEPPEPTSWPTTEPTTAEVPTVPEATAASITATVPETPTTP